MPDLAALDRERLQRCPHALDLDVSGVPVLRVGYLPARLAWHSVCPADPDRVWTLAEPLENRYRVLLTASAAPRAAYREAVRRHWEWFGRPAQAAAAAQQAGTAPAFLGLRLWDDWRDAVWEREARDNWLEAPLLDCLLLYEQCWTNPALEDLSGPTMLLGGFTTQNTDAEWSDARQSQCGNLLLDYYRATGTVEYLERNVASLRAQFPISPSENWAHGGYGRRAGVSSFHWGTGSGLAGIDTEEEFLRDVVVDVPSGRGIGVNGIDLNRCEVDGDRIDLALSSPFQWSRPPVVVFNGTEAASVYQLTLNGVALGEIRGAALAAGLPAPGAVLHEPGR